MCGFAGFYRLEKNATALSEGLLDAMAQKIEHRGPDDQGVFFDGERGLGLANRRLTIIDLSPAARMPMVSSDGSLVISYNGEIYNYAALRKELQNLGYEFRLNSDTETILYAFREWGTEAFHKLDGMFAFALFDKRTEDLFVVRDRFGVKPVYFSQQGGILSFASEIKAFWVLPWIERELSSRAMYHYLTFMVTPAPYTLYQGIYKVPAGYYIRVDAQKNVSFHEWYDILDRVAHNTNQDLGLSDHVENIRHLLIESTKKRLVSDVPVGAFLSGGLDSSLNVALMASFLPQVKTFTIGFSDAPEHDEFSWARLVAQQFDTDHHEISIGESEAFEYFDRMVYSLDEPLADCVCVPFFYVAQLARQHGISVVQVGEGADELFFGYPLYAQHAYLHEKWWTLAQRVIPHSLRGALEKAGNIFLANKPRHADLLRDWSLGRTHFWGGAVAFSEKQKRMLLSPAALSYVGHDDVVAKIYPGLEQAFDSYAIIDYHRKKLYAALPNADLGQEILYLELKHRLPELLLMRADKMSMAASVEAREPYLDYALVEYMFTVPLSMKYQKGTTKFLLKQVAQGILPDVIINRRKQGFGAPTTRWYGQGDAFAKQFNQTIHQTDRMKYFKQDKLVLEKTYHAAQSQYAVQRWVLQNLWATGVL